ncbi:hypothetical protein DCAR_0727077 [Daucus carota subsp. sativus]|uniref:Uncharacterized protein n=1 Tax=Daucus carota subsp. sativus TaxID=79200 RepID=A0AAF0XIX4_DAUCS|nr:hypothetical protein DCAR_0727077 [Daucus carota subsp. sativus]
MRFDTKHFRVVLLIFTIFAAIISTGRSMRVKEMGFYNTIQNELPRGPVPPSDPSPCHNRVKLMHEGEDTYGQGHFVICP